MPAHYKQKKKKSNQSMATDRNASSLNVTWMAIEKCAQVHFYADDRTMFVRLFFFLHGKHPHIEDCM